MNVPRHPELSVEGLARLGARNVCDREAIHLSGAVQPHGFLLVVDPVSLFVIAASANVPRIAHVRGDMLGVALSDVLGPEAARAVLAMHPTGNPHDALPVTVHLAGPEQPADVSYDMIAHRSGPVLVLEFEQSAGTDNAVFGRFFQRQRNAVRALLSVDAVEEICELTVREVRKLTGYDRVMIYRFEPDGHGHVAAEARLENAEPFLGLHYPASDVPRQARALYMRNWIRVIADVDYEPVPIIARPEGFAVDRLDLSMCVLRSVSPLHLQYLRNMGVASTMTISLIVDNQLWGLIACHHSNPKLVNHVQRLAYEALGQLVSVRLRAAEAAKHHQHIRELGQMAAQVVAAMAAAENPAAGAAVAAQSLLGMTAADGAVVEIEGVRMSIGTVPGVQVLDLLVPYLIARAGADPAPLTADALPDLAGMPVDDEISNASAAAGTLFLPLPGRVQGFILWLRMERARTVRWAGRSNTKIDDDGEGEEEVLPLSPRASFAEWLEEVRGLSLPWRAAEVAAANELAQAMPEVLQHRAQNRLVRLALHDPLTGLPNRVQLHDRLDKLLVAAEPDPGGDDDARQLGVLFVDIDGFKAVNDTQGHLIGDELLAMVAQRLVALIRPQDTVARMGGDEFVILVPDIDAHEATAIGQRMVEDFRRSFLLGGQLQRFVSLSIGVTVVPKGTEPAEALRQADAAMYHAKRSGRDQVATYDPSSGTAASHQQLAAEELRDAIDCDEITVRYQPILAFNLAGAAVLSGFEALARWQHPRRGLLLPDLFIGLAEETGLIHALGYAVMRQALRQLQIWPDRRLTVAVNVSVRELVRPGFASEVLSCLLEFGIEPGRLCLEITESQMMEQPLLALAVLTELCAADVCIAIDDFGTGFSSLAYMRDLPATLLKIDRLFVSSLPHNLKDIAVVTAIIRLAHSLGMRTVAEGVENSEQLAHLRDLGSDFVQGYLLGKPMTAEAVLLKLATMA